MDMNLNQDIQLILDSQDRVLKGFDVMIRKRQGEIAEKLQRKNAEKLEKKSDILVAKK